MGKLVCLYNKKEKCKIFSKEEIPAWTITWALKVSAICMNCITNTHFQGKKK